MSDMHNEVYSAKESMHYMHYEIFCKIVCIVRYITRKYLDD